MANPRDDAASRVSQVVQKAARRYPLSLAYIVVMLTLVFILQVVLLFLKG